MWVVWAVVWVVVWVVVVGIGGAVTRDHSIYSGSLTPHHPPRYTHTHSVYRTYNNFSGLFLHCGKFRIIDHQKLTEKLFYPELAARVFSWVVYTKFCTNKKIIA